MTQRVAIAVTVLNLLLAVCTFSRSATVSAQGAAPVLRGQSLEIVDASGRVRAFLGVLPASAPSGQTKDQSHPETVLLRLMDPGGRPTVKLGASGQGAGLGLYGASDTHGTWVIVEAEGRSGVIRFKDEPGQEQRLTAEALASDARSR